MSRDATSRRVACAGQATGARTSGWPLRVLLVAVLFGATWMPCSSPATVAEQRQRLPPPATCTDPVEGIWRAHFHDPRRAAWREFTLEIHRADAGPDALQGWITNHGWQGDKRQEQPPSCGPGVDRWRIKMDAAGSYQDGRVSFGGIRWWLEEQVCGRRQWGPGSYNVDRFTGTIETERQEFQSVGNDDGVLVNVPMVFRRIRCFDEQDHTNPGETDRDRSVPVPALAPRQRAASCCGSTEP